MIKRTIRIVLLLALAPLAAAAQVEKQVEVSKSYLPEVAAASKLAIVPDRTDTVKIRPDIDYTVEPRSFDTHLTAHTFRPATVTYWEFNRPTPYYLKVGAGYPLNSVADFYASTQHPSIGYALLYLNHDGEYGKIRNDAGERLNSTRMTNRIGAAAGRYLGRHQLEGAVWYDNRMHHRYGASETAEDPMAGSRIQFGEAGIRVRIGDDFFDDRKVNFNVEGYGTFLHDDSKTLSLLDARQIDGGGEAEIGFRFRKHQLRIRALFDGCWGAGDLSSYSSYTAGASLRYAFASRTVDAEAGLDYAYSRITTSAERNPFHYLLPYLRLHFNVGNGAFVPFIEVDGRVEGNDFRTLVRENPYVITGFVLPKNTVDYNLRFGVSGNVGNRFAYRLFICMTWLENARYWYGMNFPQAETTTDNYLQFGIAQARRNTAVIGGELRWRPARDFRIDWEVRGFMHDFTARIGEHKLGGGLPALETTLKMQYDHRRFSIGASARLVSTRYWTNIAVTRRTDEVPATAEGAFEGRFSTYEVPITVDVRLNADYRVSRRVTIFAEGRNLANRRLYEWANYPLHGAGFTAGVKCVF